MYVNCHDRDAAETVRWPRFAADEGGVRTTPHHGLDLEPPIEVPGRGTCQAPKRRHGLLLSVKESVRVSEKLEVSFLTHNVPRIERPPEIWVASRQPSEARRSSADGCQNVCFQFKTGVECLMTAEMSKWCCP